MHNIKSELEQQGFSIVHGVLRASEVAALRNAINPLVERSPAAGIRGLAQKVPGIRELAESQTIRALVEPVLGLQARMVRSVLFNKNQATNWHVAWHQDLAIAVQHQAEAEGFISWSVKDGVAHVQPPIEILENMLTVRLHLDDADESNGALWVSPGSHRFGRLPADAAAAVAERHGKKLCAVQMGDALLFHPLVLHASRKATSGNPRRVIHLEFAGITLPAPLVWNEAA